MSTLYVTNPDGSIEIMSDGVRIAYRDADGEIGVIGAPSAARVLAECVCRLVEAKWEADSDHRDLREKLEAEIAVLERFLTGCRAALEKVITENTTNATRAVDAEARFAELEKRLAEVEPDYVRFHEVKSRGFCCLPCVAGWMSGPGGIVMRETLEEAIDAALAAEEG